MSARDIWDRYINQDPQEFVEFTECTLDNVDDVIGDYIATLPEMFSMEDITDDDIYKLKDAMYDILLPILEAKL